MKTGQSIEQRKLAAIMFTDMVGYSALAQRDDKRALELLEEHRELLRETFPRFNGTEIKTIGDAFLVEFNSALEAAQCAIAIQRVLAKRNADAAAERQIQVRIGIHIGDVVHRGGDVYGDGVNIASRIEQAANAGGICVSMDVERQIRNALDARFEKLAPTELKNISVPMDLFRIALPWESPGTPAAKIQAQSKSVSRKFLPTAIAFALLLVIVVGWWWQRSRTTLTPSAAPSAAAATEKSIAVLPFENLSEEKGNAYFADGIQEEILTRLAKIAELKVISRTSTQQFKSKPEDLPQIAKQLGVANILEGSVQKAADQVRVNVQLINAASDVHLWAETYDREVTDIFAVESEIAKMVADTLQAKLTGSEKRAISIRPTDNPVAYQDYLKGRYFWSKRTGDNFKTAISYFEQAINNDPGFALAYAGLADTYVLLPAFTWAAPRDAMPKAKAAAQKALELDESLAEAHTSLAMVLRAYDFDYNQAVSEFKRAIELNPNYAPAHYWFGTHVLSALSRFEEAIAEAKRAIELDPLSLVANVDLGTTYVYARRFDDAVAQLRKAIELDDNFYYAHFELGIALQSKGLIDAAIVEYEKAHRLNDDPEVSGLLGQAYAVRGRRDDALKMLTQLKGESARRYVPAYTFALIYLGLGEKEESMRWLEKDFSDQDGWNIGFIKVEPRLDPLRGDPRFEALVQKVLAPKSSR